MTEAQETEFRGILNGLAEYKELFPSLKDLGTVEGGFAAIKKLPDTIKSQEEIIGKLRADLDTYRKAQITAKLSRIVTPGQVSEGCALHLGALAICAAQRQGRFEIMESRQRDALIGRAKEILGIEIKTALSASDIPLPVEYSGEVVELVSLYGAARRYGTVYPLGTGSVKLPRLKTDTVFTLLAAATAITEKSPQTEWVTFTPEKFGGMVRLPTEIEEDSIVALGQFIARYSARNIARVEDHNFFIGTGGSTGANGAVEGLTVSTITNSKAVQMAGTKTHYSDATLANLRALRAKPDEGAISNSAYYMHTSFEQHLSGLNTAGDKPYIANGINGASLDGFPIRWVPIMPAYSTGANVSTVFALFGDLSFQYLGVRGGIRFDSSAHAGFETDETLIRALERFTIGLMATGAVAGLETAAA